MLRSIAAVLGLLLLVAHRDAAAQGTLYFANRAAPISLDAPVYEVGGSSLAWGGPLTASLWIGATPDALALLNVPVSWFEPGYWLPETVSYPLLPGGATAFVQIRVWSLSRAGSYDDVAAAGGRHGASEVFPVVLGGDTLGGTQPPSFPAYLAGLKSITLVGTDVPEAGAGVLFTAGVAMLAMFRAGRRRTVLAIPALAASLGALLGTGPRASANDTFSGQILLPHRASGSAPWVLDLDGRTPLDSSFDTGIYQADVWYGTEAATLRKAPRASMIGSGPDAGLAAFEIPIALPGIAPGGRCWIQVEVWSFAHGPDRDEALAHASPIGRSAVIEVVAGTALVPRVITNLPPFALVPTPKASVRFGNLVPGVLDAPVFSVAGTTRLSGPGYVAQLYARRAADPLTDLAPVGKPVPFGTGERAGYWGTDADAIVTIPRVAAGQTLEVQVFAWRLADGATFEQAGGARGPMGSSGPLRLATSPTSGEPAVLAGLRSFRLLASPVGTVDFRNLVPGGLDARVTLRDPLTLDEKAAPETMVAELLVAEPGASPDAFVPAGPPVPFGRGTRTGYWPATPGPSVIEVRGFHAGQVVWARVRLWDSSVGSTYDLARFGGPSGEYGLFELRLGGVDFAPAPTLPPTATFNIDDTSVRRVHLDIRNRVPGILDHPVYGPGGGPLSGANYVAQMFVQTFGPLGIEMLPNGTPAPFGTGADAGYWNPGGAELVGIDVAIGCCAEVEIRIWDQQYGATFEAAAAGPRAVSRRLSFFPANERQFLRDLGYLTLESYRDPGVVVTVPASPWIVDATTDGQPFDRPGYVAQLYVTGQVGPAFDQGFGGVPAGPRGAIGTGASAGLWDVPSRFIVELPEAIVPGTFFAIQLRVWNESLGSSYDEAVAAGSRIGLALPGNPFGAFLARRRTEGPPPEIEWRGAVVRGPKSAVFAPPGLHLVGNPASRSSANGNRIANLVTTPPPGTMLFLFDDPSQAYIVASYHRAWDLDALVIPPGRAVFVFNPGTSPIAFAFEGEPGPLPAAVRPERRPAYTTRANTLGREATFTELTGLAPRDGDTVFRFVAGAWKSRAFDFGAWSDGAPTFGPGEAVFLRLAPSAP